MTDEQIHQQTETPEPVEDSAENLPAETHTENDIEEPEVDTGLEPYQLDVPPDVPAGKLDDHALATLQSFATAAHGAGLSKNIAEAMVNSFADAAAALGVDNVYEGTRDDAENVLRGLWGQNYDVMMKTVRGNVNLLGRDFSRWLDETNVGNDPRAVMALANLAEYQRNPADAKRELERLTATPDYVSQDKRTRALVVARVQALSRVSHRADADRERAATRRAGTRRADPTADRQAAARREAAAMLADRNSPLMNAGHRDHAAAVTRYHELVAQL